jgi:hypothetical protein
MTVHDVDAACTYNVDAARARNADTACAYDALAGILGKQLRSGGSGSSSEAGPPSTVPQVCCGVHADHGAIQACRV